MQPLPLLHEETLRELRTTRNLLAFSGGGDSTALFFLLMKEDIPFDIAFVNYKTRAQSDEEEAYAHALSQTYAKRLFTLTCKLSKENFEHHARLKRYTFFEEIIKEHSYDTLLSAHHLGDKLEWFLMQLCKGAGLVEMLGMQESEMRGQYTLVRPLLHLSKPTLLSYLHSQNIHYYTDESNASLEHLRNHFRHHFAIPLLESYERGIANSFAYLEEDSKRLLPLQIKRIGDLFIFSNTHDTLISIRYIDKILKQLGIVMSASQRKEILRVRQGVIGGKIAVCMEEETIYIAPYCRAPMDKHFKETCRKYKIPSKIRPYLYHQKMDPSALR